MTEDGIKAERSKLKGERTEGRGQMTEGGGRKSRGRRSDGKTLEWLDELLWNLG